MSSKMLYISDINHSRFTVTEFYFVVELQRHVQNVEILLEVHIVLSLKRNNSSSFAVSLKLRRSYSVPLYMKGFFKIDSKFSEKLALQ